MQVSAENKKISHIVIQIEKGFGTLFADLAYKSGPIISDICILVKYFGTDAANKLMTMEDKSNICVDHRNLTQ